MYMRKKYTGLETLHLFLDRAHNSQQIEAEYSQPEKGKENGTLMSGKKNCVKLIQPSLWISKPFPPKKKISERSKFFIHWYIFIVLSVSITVIKMTKLDLIVITRDQLGFYLIT